MRSGKGLYHAWNGGHPWFFDSYRIGNCSSLVLRVFEIWQFAFPTFVASNNCAGNHFKAAGT